MRDNRIAFTVVFFFTWAPLWAVENPNVQSPIGSPTAVPSASRSGLTPNRAYNASGANDIITGNVGGLRHFRGVLPYNSSYYSGTTAYSPVDDFLRRSYDPIVNDRSPGLNRPYYDPRRTISSSVRADGSGLFSPTITNQGQNDPYTPPMLAQTLNTQYRQRPLSLSGSELERLMSRQIQLRESMERQRSLTNEKDPAVISDIRTESLYFQDYLRTETERMTQTKELSSEKPAEEQSEPLPEENPLETLPENVSRKLPEDSPQRITDLLRPRPALPGSDETTPQTELTPEEAARQAAEKAQVSALLSRYGDFEHLAKARVAEYLAAAEGFLKTGKYYKAADSFALAAIWGPEDIRPFVGQSVSLFAAGEYMSSAYLLRQAISKNPKVASEKIDISALLGDRDVFENRLIEMATWQQRSGSGELAFLIAYVMHHDGKAQGAAEAIHLAAEKMPDDMAVATLKQAIIPENAAQ